MLPVSGNPTPDYHMLIPPQSKLLSIRRSRLIEVSYIIRLTLNNTITLDVPLNIINFLSIDPPPSLNLTMPANAMTATDSSRIEMAVDSSVRANEDFGGKQARYSGQTEESKMEILISERSSSRASKTKSQVFYPKDRQRAESIYQEDERRTPRASPRIMPEPPSPYNKPRPLSMSSLPAEPATPATSSFRPPFSKRESTASYFSAVASLAENEDLEGVEARRRHGRQMSLAALTAKPNVGPDEDITPEDSPAVTPQSGTFAPSVSLTATVEDSGHHELEEAERDLEFVRRVSAEYQQDPSEEHQSSFERDSESRFLEEELQEETGYRSRQSVFGSEASHGSGLDHHGDLLEPDNSVETVQNATAPAQDNSHSTDSASPFRLSTQSLEMLQEEETAHGGNTHLDVSTREQRHGSIAASAISGVSGVETEIGQVVQAIRRDLSIRQTPANGKEALEFRLQQARSRDSCISSGPVQSNSFAPPYLIPPQVGRRPSASPSWIRKDSFLLPSMSASRANSIAVETIIEQDDPSGSDVQLAKVEGTLEATAPAVELAAVISDPREAQSSAFSPAQKPLRIVTPVDGISESPGLTPSIAEESASSHGGSRASTPRQETWDTEDEDALQVVDEVPAPLSPTDRALEQLMLEADETMASLGLDSVSRKNVGLRYSSSKDFNRMSAPRSPAGPRQRNSFSSTAPGSPLSQYSESLDHGHELQRSPESTPVKEQTTPTRRSHTAILGAARNRFSNRTSGTSHTTDYMTHSPGSSISSQHMVVTPGRYHQREFEGQYHLEDIPEIRSMASDPSLRKKAADERSITSISTSATTMGAGFLERKSSGHVFPYSQQMTGYTSQQLRPINSRSDEY